MRTQSGRIDPIRFSAVGMALLLCLSLLFCGCAKISALLPDDESESSRPTPEPTEATPEPTVYHPQNPVFALYEGYLKGRGAACEGLLSAAAESGDARLVSACSAFFAAEAQLTLVYATVGMLSSDGVGFAGSFTGAYAGSGTLSSRGIFEYEFEDGSGIAGRIDGGLLYCNSGVDIEPPIDPDEPTPEPTAYQSEETSEAPEETAGASETAATEQTEETPGAETTVEPSPSPSTEAALGGTVFDNAVPGAVFIALYRTQDGWLGIVSSGDKAAFIQIENGALYIAEAKLHSLPEGIDPLSGIAGEMPDPLGCAVLKYAEGTAELLLPSD